MHMISLQYSVDLVDDLQDGVTTTQHTVTCTMLVDDTVKNKTVFLLLNIINNTSRTTIIIN